MPSHSEQIETLGGWRDFPGLERTGAETAVLTFDDGPDEDTPALLDALDEAGVKATFFLVGEQLMRHIRLGREIVERGHEVALHGFHHAPHDEMTPTAARDDLARGLGTLQAGCALTPRFCRPPYGRFAEGSYAACERLELEPVYWSAWGLDWETISPERIADLVLRDLVPGAVVLLHDSARYASRPSAMPTVEAIPLIAEGARERGVGFSTLGEAVPKAHAAT